jgi:hypothetical protein
MILLSLALATTLQTAEPPRTLRLDYVHIGTDKEEHFALRGLVLEGPWPGSLLQTIDDTNFGSYFFEVRDLRTNHVLYSRGFSSIFDEWKDTSEAKERSRAFSESLRFPLPQAPVQVVLKRRDERNAFREAWSLIVDPADPTIDRAGPPGTVAVWSIQKNGEPSEKVDLLLMGDGYTAAEMPKWHADARRLAEMLFSHSPFKERLSDFNVWAVDTPSEDSGVSRPSDGVYKRSALGTAYDTFGSERYVLSFDNERIRRAASAAPYEFIEIAVNDRKYGGGGLFNQYATVAVDNAFTPYVFVHEFGHHFAGLADEYYTSEVAQQLREPSEPWEANVTIDPRASKWRELISPGTPLPTPWAKEAYETAQREIQGRRRQIRAQGRPEDEMEALFREERERMTLLLAQGPYAGAVGAFEGAGYRAKGYFRPRADCLMFGRDEVGFCPVCRRAIERIIDLYARRR